jgi:hypothetical protein
MKPELSDLEKKMIRYGGKINTLKAEQKTAEATD